MLNLTTQERQAILFVLAVALAGIGINFTLKVNAPIRKIIQIEAENTKINLNQAGFAELTRLNLVSPQLARKIIDLRNSRGSLQSLKELKEIKGIGECRYKKLEELFYLE